MSRADAREGGLEEKVRRRKGGGLEEPVSGEASTTRCRVVPAQINPTHREGGPRR